MILFFHLLSFAGLIENSITGSFTVSIMLILIYVKSDITDHKILWFQRAHFPQHLVVLPISFFFILSMAPHADRGGLLIITPVDF